LFLQEFRIHLTFLDEREVRLYRRPCEFDDFVE